MSRHYSPQPGKFNMRKSKANSEPNEDVIARLALALNHPDRRRILKALMQEPGSATSLSRAFGMPLGNIAYHLIKVLYEECDVVTVIEVNPRRGAHEKVFALKPEAFVGALDWKEVPEPIRSGLRGVGLRYFQDAAIGALEAEADEPDEASAYVCRPIQVDEDGKREIREALKEFIGKVTGVEGRFSEADPADLLNLVVGAAAFEPAPPLEVNADD